MGKNRNKKGISILIVVAILFSTVEASQWWMIYFTAPGKKGVEGGINPEKGLIKTINKANNHFYGAFYDISSPAVIEALIGADQKGIDVKIVMERDNAGTALIQKLIEAGVEVVTDNRHGLMHNKFAVADGKIVWTGSYNPTVNGAEKNNNNAIKIYSEILAKIYTNEFMEMFESRVFGNRKDAGPFAQIRKKYFVKLENTNINVYFSPEDNIERIILKRLQKAEKSIHFMAFTMTSDRIGEMMIKKYKEGVKVYGILEKRGAMSEYSEFVKLKIEDVHVRLDKNRGIMHHKVIIIDKQRVITGSYNFTKNADKKNDENILIIDNREIAGKYLREFHKLY